MDPVPLDITLLPNYIAERDRVDGDYSLWSYVETHGTVELAIAFSKVFWPDFIEHRGCIILADRFTEAGFEEWWQVTNGEVATIESIMNHQHIDDLLLNDPDYVKLDKRVIDYLGHTLANMWEARVRTLFPEREFVVEYLWENDFMPTVYLYQKPQSS